MKQLGILLLVVVSAGLGYCDSPPDFLIPHPVNTGLGSSFDLAAPAHEKFRKETFKDGTYILWEWNEEKAKWRAVEFGPPPPGSPL